MGGSIIDLRKSDYDFTDDDSMSDDEIMVELVYEKKKAYMVLNPDGEEVSIAKSVTELVEKSEVRHSDGDVSTMLRLAVPLWLIERENLK